MKMSIQQEKEEEDEWDFELTEEDLKKIDAICEEASTTASTERVPAMEKERAPPPTLRRLPDSLFNFKLHNCRNNRYSPYDSRDDLKMRFPEITFKGHVAYSKTAKEADKAALDLLEFVRSNKENGHRVALGFDIEWKPTFKRGVAPGKAAVMQICTSNSHCYVIHIFHSGITQKLKHLLEDPAVVKVGVCIANDAYKVLQDYNISVKNVEDLSDLANHKLGGPPRKWSLARLTETLISKQLPKPYKIRLGNWEAKVLSKEQLQYAAADAFVSWYLYQVLQSLPEPVNDKTEEIGTGLPN